MKTKEIYKLRNSYSIVGLTGRTGSGCSRFSKIISKDIKFDKNEMIRRPIDIEYLIDDNLSDNNTLFKRKYSICYNYFKKNNSPYKEISYLSVLIFYSIHYAVHKKDINTPNELIDFIHNLINENFKKGVEGNSDDDYVNVKITKEEVRLLSDDFNEILTLFKSVQPEVKKIKDISDFKKLYKCFFEKEFDFLTKNLLT